MRYESLTQFIEKKMSMSHIYQPLLIRTLVEAGGTATLRQLALAFVVQDESQIKFYQDTIKRMPLPVLRRHGVVERDGDLVSLTAKKLTFEQKALQKQRDRMDEARNGQLAQQSEGPKRLFGAVDAYLKHKTLRCSPRTLELEEERLSVVKKHFGDVKLRSMTATAIAEFQETRNKAGIANRTINMDVGVLRRVLKHTGRWKALEDRVQNLPENQKAIGRALTQKEQTRLLETALSNPNWEHVYCAAALAANTSLRPVEVKHLRWKDLDLLEGTVTVTRSKNESSHRVIPLNATALEAIKRMLGRAESQGFAEPEHYIWHASQWNRPDPTRPTKSWDNAWRSLRDAADLTGLRFHDLRHTIITELAEMGVPDHVMKSITGHLSRRMLEHYSHIRLQAKREALEELDARRAAAAKKDEVAEVVQ